MNEWNVKYNRLKEGYDKTGGVTIKVKNRDLACWLSRQKTLLRCNMLDHTREELLAEANRNLLLHHEMRCLETSHEQNQRSEVAVAV
jgi:hypothetical protein